MHLNACTSRKSSVICFTTTATPAIPLSSRPMALSCLPKPMVPMPPPMPANHCYCATDPGAGVIRFHASGMCLYIDSDASYLSEPKLQSWAGGIFSNPFSTSTPNNPDPPLKGVVQVVSNILCKIMSSALKAKFGGLFYNRQQEACPICQGLLDIGYLQPAKPMKILYLHRLQDCL